MLPGYLQIKTEKSYTGKWRRQGENIHTHFFLRAIVLYRCFFSRIKSFNNYRQTSGLGYNTFPPIFVECKWSIGPKSTEWEDITIKESSEENCREKIVKTTTEKDLGNQKLY